MQYQQIFLFILLILSNCFLVTSKRIIPPSSSNSHLNACACCKILTDSFTYWMDKTSRGKFEGGDAAWEEAKLKSYARSEIRLVEVQEGLCSEVEKHQSRCYSLAEEAEQPLEKWWFKEDPNAIDLYNWLCIDTLQHCCPKLHFGESCSPCPLDKDNKICSGNGKCDGEGTREGNGTCICKKGYTGIYCEACDNNFYRGENNNCLACHKACEGCNGKGANECLACKTGWILEDAECRDINECLESSSCNTNQYCVNIEGSHMCKKCDKSCATCSGPGIDKCTACESDRLLWSGMCVDDKLKSDFIMKAIQKLFLYFGFCIILILVFRHLKFLAAFVIVIIATYVYYAESKSKMNTLETVLNYIFNSR